MKYCAMMVDRVIDPKAATRRMETSVAIRSAQRCRLANCRFSNHLFNANRGKRVQYPLILGSLGGPLGEKMELLRHFLVCAFQECTPHDWVCLHSLPNCLEQPPHSDYVREDVEEAVAIHGARGYPFECQLSICDVFTSYLTSFYVLH